MQNAPLMAYLYKNSDFGSYESGIFACNTPISKTQLNYHTQIVGYDENQNSLIVKLALGTSWG